MKNVSVKILVFVIFCFMQNISFSQGGNCAQNVNNKMNITSFNKYLPNAAVDLGYYISKKDEDTFCIEMVDNLQRKKQHYMIINCFDSNDFQINNNTSSVQRASGSLTFEGDIQNRGEFTFLKDANFVQFLEDEGVELNNDLYYFKLFLGDIDRGYLLDIKKLGYQPSITELGRLVWHDASVSYIEEIGTLLPNLDLSEISMMSAHEISIEYLRGFVDLGFKNLEVNSVKKAKSYGITPQLIEEQNRLGNNFNHLKDYIGLFKKRKNK